MKILGIAAPFGHDSSAALLVNGKVLVAAEEERFVRRKHAKDHKPINAVNFCLKKAGLKPEDIDYVAYSWSYKQLRKKRAEYFRRTIFTDPSRAYKKFFRNKKELTNQNKFINSTLSTCGFNLAKTKIKWIGHHLTHVASSFYLSGFKEAAVASIDGGGEITATLLGHGKDKKIKVLKEIIAPDSLGNFYSTITDYLGFWRENGEYKVMGMAPYGNPDLFNFDHIVSWDKKKAQYFCSDDYVWVRRKKRFRTDKVYSKKMVHDYGPERSDSDLAEPYTHIAAAAQKKLEEIVIKLIDVYLKNSLEKTRALCFSGGCALNVALNRILLKHPLIDKLWVQPASNDAGGSLGAAVYLAAKLGEDIKSMNHAYLGPDFSNDQIKQELEKSDFFYFYHKDICTKTAELLDEGKIVGWFQGRMEWGPRALGNRSILGNPTVKGTADKINEQIKFREKWRPFCPSILSEYAPDILNSDHPAPFMTIAFEVNSRWRNKIPEVVHVNGTCRPQIVDKKTNPKFYDLIGKFYEKTRVPVLINTSLNRKGEPIVCSPKDALDMFSGCGLKYLAIGDFLITKK